LNTLAMLLAPSSTVRRTVLQLMALQIQTYMIGTKPRTSVLIPESYCKSLAYARGKCECIAGAMRGVNNFHNIYY
jgi:predicted house-cleaning NTP pyrophosphatase (Maf/HAM1 superfamily)